ncbi:MAG: hypothetical protein HYX38_35190 [Rhodospirillales bacterium]|nr:hypothetical protein [Rhodospirillales bacterium]
MSGKGAAFLGQRIGQDALTIAELVEQVAAKDARIAELEAVLTPRQREHLKAKEPKE